MADRNPKNRSSPIMTTGLKATTLSNVSISAAKRDTVAVLAVLPRYWGRNKRDSRGDGDQACGTTVGYGVGFFSRICNFVKCTCMHYRLHCLFVLFTELSFELFYFTEQRFIKYSHC